jgi:hypothetical protein
MATFVLMGFFTLQSGIQLPPTTDAGWDRPIRYHTRIETEAGNHLVADLRVHGSSSTHILSDGSVAFVVAKAVLRVNRIITLLSLNFAGSPFDEGSLPYSLGCFAFVVGRVIAFGGGHKERTFTVCVDANASRTESHKIVRCVQTLPKFV